MSSYTFLLEAPLKAYGGMDSSKVMELSPEERKKIKHENWSKNHGKKDSEPEKPTTTALVPVEKKERKPEPFWHFVPKKPESKKPETTDKPKKTGTTALVPVEKKQRKAEPFWHFASKKSTDSTDKPKKPETTNKPKTDKPKKSGLTVGETLAAGTVAAGGVYGIGKGIQKIIRNKKKTKLQKTTDAVKEQYGKFKKLPNGEKIAVAAIPATVLAGGAAAIYAWWKKKHNK